MFSNNLQSFIILYIYILVLVNILLLGAIYLEIIKDKLKKRHYLRTASYLYPLIIASLDDQKKQQQVVGLLKTNYLKMVAIDIIEEYAEENHRDLSAQFESLGLVSFIIKKLKKRPGISDLKKLALMGSQQGYVIFMDLAKSNDLDISYMSFYGLSRMAVPTDKKIAAIQLLLGSDIYRDRIIELLRQFQLEFEEWLKLLETETSVKGKVILIKAIMIKDEIRLETYSDRVEKFLDQHNEVKIAAIQALSYSRNEKYVEQLIKIYQQAENWQVRVAVAKGLSSFKFDCVKDVLLKMTRDSEWWVRYNAIKSIVSMGEDGLFSLIDLSLESDDSKISDLAYYFLNANHDVYNTVKNIEV